MPEIFDVANHFDDISITDGYTGAYLFKAQLSTFLDASPDGSVAQRRVMSTAPGIVIPARRAISAFGEDWLVGAANVDGIYGQVIRQSFWTKKVSDTFSKLTPGEAALGAAGTTLFGHRSYLKDTVNGVSDAEYDPFWEIYFSPTESVDKGHFLRAGGKHFRVRSSHLEIDGLTSAACDELDAGEYLALTFTAPGAYDPVADTYTGSTVSTTGLLFDRYKWYDQQTEADLKSMSGDMNIVVAKSAITPAVGHQVTIAGRDWQLLAVTSDLDSWACHIRRA
jgi:hypothetical protein